NNTENTGAHDLYMIGGSVATYTAETTLTNDNKRLQDANASGSSYVEKYGACSYTVYTEAE
ncbi:MAG: hypothetical protein IJ013_05125, partial [Bacteroidaceae bacterium]|nr:hypothetical protein [Bacteroidaceae bacterium]